jgi:hypothetical protein
MPSKEEVSMRGDKMRARAPVNDVGFPAHNVKGYYFFACFLFQFGFVGLRRAMQWRKERRKMPLQKHFQLMRSPSTPKCLNRTTFSSPEILGFASVIKRFWIDSYKKFIYGVIRGS